MMTLDIVVNFFSLKLHFFLQAPASDAKVVQSTGLFDGSSDMFRVSMIALVGVLGVAICIGLAYHYVIFLPQRKKGKGESLCLCNENSDRNDSTFTLNTETKFESDSFGDLKKFVCKM